MLNPEQLAELSLRLTSKIMRYRSGRIKALLAGVGGDAKRLSGRRFFILFNIGMNNMDCLTKIAHMQGLSPAAMSTVMSRMEEEGLLHKSYPTGEADGRRVIFGLTEKGVTTLNGLITTFLTELDHFYSSLSGDNKKHFTRGFKLLSLFVDYGRIDLGRAGDNNSKLSADILKAMIAAIYMIQNKFLTHFDKNGKHTCPLSISRFMALYNIQRLSEATLSELSVTCGVLQSAMSTTMKSLCEQGFAMKKRGEDDKRRLSFTITDAGKQVLDHIIEQLTQIFKAHLDIMTTPQRECLSLGLSDLYSAFINETQGVNNEI